MLVENIILAFNTEAEQNEALQIANRVFKAEVNDSIEAYILSIRQARQYTVIIRDAPGTEVAEFMRLLVLTKK